MMKRNRWMLIALALPFLYLPLRAAETPAPQAQAETAPPPEAEAAPAEEAEPAPPPPRTSGQPREQLSLDNNLSFPVDI